jgi:hypothetical protein
MCVPFFFFSVILICPVPSLFTSANGISIFPFGSFCFSWLGFYLGMGTDDNYVCRIMVAWIGAFIPLWILPSKFGPLSAGAFFIQFGVQGAWGVVSTQLVFILSTSFEILSILVDFFLFCRLFLFDVWMYVDVWWMLYGVVMMRSSPHLHLHPSSYDAPMSPALFSLFLISPLEFCAPSFLPAQLATLNRNSKRYYFLPSCLLPHLFSLVSCLLIPDHEQIP